MRLSESKIRQIIREEFAKNLRLEGKRQPGTPLEMEYDLEGMEVGDSIDLTLYDRKAGPLECKVTLEQRDDYDYYVLQFKVDSEPSIETPYPEDVVEYIRGQGLEYSEVRTRHETQRMVRDGDY